MIIYKAQDIVLIDVLGIRKATYIWDYETDPIGLLLVHNTAF